MTRSEIRILAAAQRAYFQTGATLDIRFRLQALRRLRDWILDHEGEIAGALRRDLGKSPTESWLCETGMVLSELRFLLRHTPAFARGAVVPATLSLFPARCRQRPTPLGTVLILSPWNYPFLLAIDPLADALAAGNTAILKPSACAPHTSQLIARLARECFPPEYVAVVPGRREENACLLEEPFDHIFFTGSQRVGREVMSKAAEHLTPVTLELGGKSPCIVLRDADLRLTARRIVFGKFLNCGQTCVAPDYILCDRRVKDALLDRLREQVRLQFGPEPLENPDYGRIINAKHFRRLTALIDPEKTALGGGSRRETLQIEPTILDPVTFEDPVMEEEIFGPLLPVLTFDRLEDALEELSGRPRPLALYLFTRDLPLARRIMDRCRFGGGCINDVVVHLATSRMGFGGMGESGMGSYHGEAGLRTFSHTKSMVERGAWPDPPLRYQPYRPLYGKLLRRILR